MRPRMRWIGRFQASRRANVAASAALHAGRSDAQTAALGLDGLAKSLSPIRAVGEYLAWLVRQGLRSGFAIIHVCGRNCDFLDQSRVGVSANMRLEAIDCRPAFVFDPARLAVAFARGGNDGGVDKRSCLDPDRLGLELGGDLVEQRLVQVLSDEGFPEPNEGGALRRGFIPREPAIASERRAIVQGFSELHVRKIVPHGKQHRLNKANGGHAGSPFAEQEMLANRRSIGAQSIKSCRSSSEQRRPASELTNARVS